ncbi:MAG TPA: methyltransferase domain-containing protein [Roseiflexaceae bacterium]|nr:methyltransferase domain-containing protein [Roseiflexaceae bacterium]
MPLLPTLPRSAEPELLDSPAHDLAALADNLRDLRALDRYLGGTALTWRALRPMLRTLPPGTPATLLDVATGGADGPRLLAWLARRHGYDLWPLASDRLADVLQLARRDGARFPLVQHDALAIPLHNAAVDFVTCSLALHHFDPPAAVALLRELCRVARRGVVINDLRRGRLAYLGAQLLARGPWHAMARHDGPLSVLRAYTLDEARALVTQAGIGNARVVARPLFRMLIVIQPR